MDASKREDLEYVQMVLGAGARSDLESAVRHLDDLINSSDDRELVYLLRRMKGIVQSCDRNLRYVNDSLDRFISTHK